jgi:gliding motility-associated lipoprotein GldH
VYFPVSGEFTVAIQQGMREEILEGIHDVGFRVEKTSPE